MSGNQEGAGNAERSELSGALHGCRSVFSRPSSPALNESYSWVHTSVVQDGGS
jgi:hypothetical protein